MSKIVQLSGPSWWDACNALGSPSLWAEFTYDGGRQFVRITEVGAWQPGKLFHVACTDDGGNIYHLVGKCPIGKGTGEDMRLPVQYRMQVGS